MVPFIDVHCHLDFPDLLGRIDEVITSAEKAGVGVILTNGIDRESNRNVLELAKRFPSVKAALGFYPPDAKKAFDENGFEDELDFIKAHAQEITAIGEIGMDFVDDSNRKMQEKAFVSLLRLAKKLDKPVLVHSRKAEEACINLLEEEGVKKVVMHCFSGSKKLIDRCVKLKYSFSVPTTVVRAEHFQMLVNIVPLSQLFAETDSPFLSPDKEKRNEPAFVVESYKKIAELKEMSIEEVKRNLYMNWQRMFT